MSATTMLVAICGKPARFMLDRFQIFKHRAWHFKIGSRGSSVSVFCHHVDLCQQVRLKEQRDDCIFSIYDFGVLIGAEAYKLM